MKIASYQHCTGFVYSGAVQFSGVTSSICHSTWPFSETDGWRFGPLDLNRYP
jgi:hypothetical protein